MNKGKKKINLNLWGIKSLKNQGNDHKSNNNLVTLNPVYKNRKKIIVLIKIEISWKKNLLR